MEQWIAFPKCPGCGYVMRPGDEEDEGFWQCIGCSFVSTIADLVFLGNDYEDDE